MVGQIPDKIFLRRRDVMEALGCTGWEFRQMVDSGTLRPIQLYPGGYPVFHRRDVEHLLKGEESEEEKKS